MEHADKALFGKTVEEIGAVIAAAGQKPYRARQVWEALYKQRVSSLEEVTTLPVGLRASLMESGWRVGLPEIVQTAVSVDGTERYLMRMGDGETVETVWMPDGDGGERGDGSEAAEEEVGESDEIGGAANGAAGLSTPAQKRASGRDDRFLRGAGGKQVPRDARNDKQKSKSEGGDNSKGEKQVLRDAQDDNSEGSGRPERLAEGYWERRRNGRARSNFGALAERGFRRATICISSQVGCAVNCQFCLTAKLGIKRNLTAGEIAGQVAAVLNRHGIQIGKDRINLVFMGMGEPFLNYDEFMKSVRLLVDGVGIPESRMTVSTSGILPGIERFVRETVRPKLALSLNASNDEVRERIMPITRKWNIAALLEAVQEIPLRTREWVTFEYVLLGGVNDQPEHAKEVLALLAGMRAKVNLIVWNPGPEIEFHQPLPEDVARFQKMLIEGGIATYIRRPRGRDIYAACGQLKRTISEERGPQELVGIAAVE